MPCLSGDLQGLPWRGPGKGPIEVRFDGSPWEPGRSFGSRREPEREPTEAARPRPEPEPRNGGKLRQTVSTADSGGRQRGRPPSAAAPRRDPEGHPPEAARPRPEPEPRNGGKLRQTVSTADSGGRQRCRPP